MIGAQGSSRGKWPSVYRRMCGTRGLRTIWRSPAIAGVLVDVAFVLYCAVIFAAFGYALAILNR